MGGGEPSIFYRRSINNGTPDLRNRFDIGAVSDHQESEGSAIYAATNITGAASQTGGTKDAVVVAHTHGASSNDVTPALSISEVGHQDAGGGNYHRARVGSVNYYAGIGGSHSHTITVNEAGESGLNKNLPPYYALAFIMRIS